MSIVDDKLREVLDALSPSVLRQKVVVRAQTIVESFKPSSLSLSSREEMMELLTQFYAHLEQVRFGLPNVPDWYARNLATEALSRAFSGPPQPPRYRAPLRLPKGPQMPIWNPGAEMAAWNVVETQGVLSLLAILGDRFQDEMLRAYVASLASRLQQLPAETQAEVAERYLKACWALPNFTFKAYKPFSLVGNWEGVLLEHARLVLHN